MYFKIPSPTQVRSHCQEPLHGILVSLVQLSPKPTLQLSLFIKYEGPKFTLLDLDMFQISFVFKSESSVVCTWGRAGKRHGCWSLWTLEVKGGARPGMRL